MLFMVAAFFWRSWFQVHLAKFGYASSVAYDLSFFIMLPIAAVLMLPILRKNIAGMRQWFRPPTSWYRLFVYSVMLGVTLRIIYWTYLTASGAFGWLHAAGSPIVVTAHFSFSCPPAPALVLGFLVRAVLTPVFEEFVHRGFIFHALLTRGKWQAVFSSAILFGVMHRTPQSIVIAFLIGLLLAVMTLNLRTLWGAIIVHATYNLAAIIDWNCMHTSWNPGDTTRRLAAVGGASLLVMLLCLVLVYSLIVRSKTEAQIAPRS